MLYRSIYIDTDGRQATDVLEAPSEQDLHDQLGARGCLLLSARVARGQLDPGAPRRFRPLGHARLLAFSQALETSLEAGVPVLRALEALRDQEIDAAARNVLGDMIERVEHGSTLAEAMRAHPRSFSPVFCALVEAGEQSGGLADSFGTLGGFLEWKQEIGATAKQAMIYPVVILTAAYGLVVFLLAFVIPKLTGVIAKIGDGLPAHAQVLIAASSFVANNLLAVIGTTVALVIVAVLVLRTSAGRGALAALLTRLPLAHGVVTTLNTAQFCRTMSALLGSGLTVIKALEIRAGRPTACSRTSTGSLGPWRCTDGSPERCRRRSRRWREPACCPRPGRGARIHTGPVSTSTTPCPACRPSSRFAAPVRTPDWGPPTTSR